MSPWLCNVKEHFTWRVLYVYFIFCQRRVWLIEIQHINRRSLSMATPLISYVGGHDICSSTVQREIIFHLHDNNCYEKEPQWLIIPILPIFLYFHVIHEVIKVMDISRWPLTVEFQFWSQLKLGFWYRNWHFNGALVQKLPLYRDFGGEIAILQGFSKYFPSTWSMFRIYLLVYCWTIY
jgi:hypothetical protein